LKLSPPAFSFHGFIERLRKNKGMGFMRKFVSFIDNISEWTGRIFSFVTLALMIIVVYDVAMRYIINRPSQWGLEMNGFLLLAVTFLGGGYALLRDAHVRVNIIHDRFPPRVRAAVDVSTYLVFFIVCVVLLYYGSKVAWDSLRSNTRTPSTWGPVMWPSQMLIPIGAVLIGLQGLAKWIRNLKVVIKGGELKDTPTETGGDVQT
jgi:TRAP-type mannitol/chloroaromatic compound transport system permease small subunit